jgi:hypothetical protein
MHPDGDVVERDLSARPSKIHEIPSATQLNPTRRSVATEVSITIEPIAREIIVWLHS